MTHLRRILTSGLVALAVFGLGNFEAEAQSRRGVSVELEDPSGVNTVDAGTTLDVQRNLSVVGDFVVNGIVTVGVSSGRGNLGVTGNLTVGAGGMLCVVENIGVDGGITVDDGGMVVVLGSQFNKSVKGNIGATNLTINGMLMGPRNIEVEFVLIPDPTDPTLLIPDLTTGNVSVGATGLVMIARDGEVANDLSIDAGGSFNIGRNLSVGGVITDPGNGLMVSGTLSNP